MEPSEAPYPTRRQILQASAATGVAIGWAVCGRARSNDAHPGRDGSSASDGRGASDGAGANDDALDQALALLHERESRGRGGLSSHAPMVAETLCVLGHADRVVRFVEEYPATQVDLPAPVKRITHDDWRSALGWRRDAATWEARVPRWADWKEFFRGEVADSRWPDVLDLWSSRLAPGLCAAATHGVIRTSHAARALSRKDTPVRRQELACGLAYWAGAYQELPARRRGDERAVSMADALLELPLYRDQNGHAPRGNIVEGLFHVGRLEGFDRVRDLIAQPDDLGEGLSTLTATFARAYLRHGTRGQAIQFVHSVTAPCALRRIAPFVKPETARAAFPYAWQAAAGLYSAYASSKNEAFPERELTLTTSQLADRAVENGDDHAIKFTEALLSENAIRPDPAYLAAAQDAVHRL